MGRPDRTGIVAVDGFLCHATKSRSSLHLLPSVGCQDFGSFVQTLLKLGDAARHDDIS